MLCSCKRIQYQFGYQLNMIVHQIFLLVACLLGSSVLCLKPFEIEGVKYIFSDPVQKNWYQAIRYCRQKGMYLLDFESAEEYTKVRQYLRDNTNETRTNFLWTAGTSLGNEDGKYYWFTNGGDVTSEEFQPESLSNNMTNGNEFCLKITQKSDFQLHNANCDHPLHFICRATKYFKLIPRN